MTTLQALVLGIVQGVTEFLPISSSGHLVLLEKVWHMDSGGLVFIILLHLGTLVAVCMAMRREIRWVFAHPKSRVAWMLLIALLPTAIVGALFEEWFDDLFQSGVTVGFEFLITGIILWWMDGVTPGKRDEQSMSTSDSLWIGAMQGVAILPALSRSGLTIATGLWRGMSRESAGRFSFLLSIPSILGATVMKVDDIFEDPIRMHALPWGNMILGTIAAAFTGYVAVKGTLWLLSHAKMRIFALYVFALAIFVLSDQLLFHRFFPPLIPIH